MEDAPSFQPPQPKEVDPLDFDFNFSFSEDIAPPSGVLAPPRLSSGIPDFEYEFNVDF